jgi:hypothetical protein
MNEDVGDARRPRRRTRRADERDRRRRSRFRRARPAAVALAAAGVLAAGCAGPASHRGPAEPSETTLLIEFSACVRAHGLPDFPDPQSEAAGGGYPSGSLNPYLTKAAFTTRQGPVTPQYYTPQFLAAEKKCGALGLASGFVITPASIRQDVKQEIAQDECLRTHGFPDMPDPTSLGRQTLPASIDPNSPRFQAARKRCAGAGGGS